MLLLVISVVLPILITVGIGFVWTRLGYKLDSRDLTALIADVATPCLVISTFQTSRLSFEAFTAMAAAAGTAIACFAGIGALLLWATGLRIRTFLPSISFPNAGNLGLPLSLYAFGPEGLGYAIAFFSISSVANYTLGQAIAAGQANWRGLVRLPLLYAVAIGIALSFWKIELPSPIDKTITLIGNLTVPLMLLMLGASLSRLKVSSFGRATAVSAVRIGGGALVGVLVAMLFDLAGSMKAVLILQSANPVAVYNYLFAQRWNNEPEEVAGVVVLSTVASIVTIPLLLVWLTTSP
ncbi:AEC family transporter [Microvirga massiliensis]|uniref:AEC family transporter n=1 Tax=Microvirga massiliensis TaxID=1033741 RepID=UPI00062BB7EF|nr:AEC family transporter [Microvirga massiliensis]